MSMKTAQQLIQDALANLLSEGAAHLAVDSRVVKIRRQWPEKRFAQRGLPAVVVEKPLLEDDQPWGNRHRRRIYNVPIGIVDGVGVQASTKRTGEERLDLLTQRLLGYLQGEEVNSHWNLAFMHVYRSMCDFLVADPREVKGANLLMVPVTLVVPVITEAGKVWTTEELLPEGEE